MDRQFVRTRSSMLYVAPVYVLCVVCRNQRLDNELALRTVVQDAPGGRPTAPLVGMQCMVVCLCERPFRVFTKRLRKHFVYSYLKNSSEHVSYEFDKFRGRYSSLQAA